MEDRKEEKDAQAFREDVDYFLSKEEFNMFDFHERVMVSGVMKRQIDRFDRCMFLFCFSTA